MYLFLAVESNGIGAISTQTLIRVALVLVNELFDVMVLESFFIKGAKALGPAVPWHTLSQVNNGLRHEDARDLLLRRITYVYQRKGRIVAHNMEYVLTMLTQLGLHIPSEECECTMELGAVVCKLTNPHIKQSYYKYPKLSELHHCLSGTLETNWNTAEEKAYAVAQCYTMIVKQKKIGL